MADAATLQPGSAMPHLTVRTVRGSLFSYSTVWQRTSLLFVALPSDDSGAAYACQLSTRNLAIADQNAVCVVTRDAVPGLPAAAVLIADRWGEIIHVATAADVTGLPAPEDLIAWLEHVAHRCPECEGEAR